MFTSARLSAIMLIMIGFVLITSAPVSADNEIQLTAGGLTVAGPGIVKGLPPTTLQRVYTSPTGQSLSATLHCKETTAFLSMTGENTCVIGTATPDNTVSIHCTGVKQVRIFCDASNQEDCECLWRVDRLP